MMRTIVHGYTGAMGRVILERIEEDVDAVFAAGAAIDSKEEAHCYRSIDQITEEADVVIDFSHHSAVSSLLAFCKAAKLPLVLATTGHTSEEIVEIETASKEIPIFYSANMSIGVAVTASLAKQAAAAFPNADIEIIERHHHRKLDVPSGTALMLANGIAEVKSNANFVIGRHEAGKRKVEDIGIHSVRLGNEVGTHEVIIATGTETITIKHEAETRNLFADGAMAAAHYLLGKEAGLYTMKEMIEEK